MNVCHACGDPLTGGSVPLDGPDGRRVHVCGFCFLKGYTAKAYVEDQPDSWTHKAHSDYTLREHVQAMIDDEDTPSETYE